MTPFGRDLNPEYTDLAVVVGPNVQWTRDDYEDLQEFQPEVLLGYRVHLSTPDTLYRLLGRRVMKFVVLDGVERNPRWHQMSHELRRYLEFYDWATIEYWYVHRRIGIWRVA